MQGRWANPLKPPGGRSTSRPTEEASGRSQPRATDSERTAVDSERTRKKLKGDFPRREPPFSHFLAAIFAIYYLRFRTNAVRVEEVQNMHTTATRSDQLDTADAPILVAILIAARRTGDRLLETVARRELEQRHRILIRFARDREVSPCVA